VGPYRDGIKESFDKAELTLDRYHVVQLLNRALDDIRRQEQRR
jgi:transposase